MRDECGKVPVEGRKMNSVEPSAADHNYYIKFPVAQQAFTCNEDHLVHTI